MIRRSSHLLAGIVAAILTPLVLGVVVFMALVAQGELSLHRFTPQFEDLLSRLTPGLSVNLRDTVLTWDGERGRLDVRVVGAELRGPDGTVLGRFPQISVELATGAMLEGRIEAVAIEVLAADVHVVRETDGRFFLQDPDGGWRWPLAEAQQVLRQGGGEAVEGGGGGPPRLSARDVRLTFRDVGADLALRADDVSLEVDRTAAATNVTMTALLDLGGVQVPVGLGAVRQGDQPEVGVTVRFRDLALAALPRALPTAGLEVLQGVTLAAEGIVDLRLAGADGLTDIAMDLVVGPGQVALPELLPLPLQVSGGAVRAQVSLPAADVAVEWADVQFNDGLRAQFVGELGGIGGALWAQGEVGLAGFKAEQLATYWPPTLNSGARRWVVEHVYAGSVPEGRLVVDIQPGELQAPDKRPDMVQLEWRFVDGATRYFAQLPHLTDAVGRGRLNAKGMTLELESGRIADVDIDQGLLSIDDFKVKPTPLDMTFRARGPVASILATIDEKPLRLASRVGIDPATVDGEGTGFVRLQVPLKRGVKPEEVDVAAEAEITGYGVPSVLAGLPLSDGDIAVKVDRDTLHAVGAARINGVMAELDWRRPLRKQAGVRDEIKLRASLDQAGREAFGVGLGGRLDGPTWADLRIFPGPNGRAEGMASFDLALTEIAVPEVKWRKPAGAPARMQLTFASAPESGLNLTDLRFQADDMRFSGDIRLAVPLALQRAQIREVTYGETRLDFDVQALPDGAFRVEARGEQLDLRPFLADALDLDTPPATDTPDVDLNAKLASVLLSDDIRMTRVRAAASRRDGTWSQVDAGGAVNDGAPALLRIVPIAGGRLVDLRSDDAGAMARALGLYDGAVGGRMQFLARLQDPPDGTTPDLDLPQATGKLSAEGFRLVDAPVLAQMLTLGSLTGVDDLLRGDGIAMVRLRAPFTYDRGVLTVDDARAVGPALGLTATVSHDGNSGEVDASGTVVPSYTINSVLGRIPLLGDVLVGGEGEGVFAFTYKIEGSLDAPKVTVNPLSALAPGFLRNIVTSLEEPVVSTEMIDLEREVEEQRELK